MTLAELNDNYLNTCHELHKCKEKNLAIAGKMTRSVTCSHWMHMSLIPCGVQLKCVAASSQGSNCELDNSCGLCLTSTTSTFFVGTPCC